MKQPPLYPAQRGFTALELIIVLVIGFSIIALSASKMGELFSSSKATQAISNILALKTAVTEFRGPNGYDPGDQIPDLIKADMIPKPLKATANSKLKNEWNADITITADSSTDQVTIVYGSVPKAPCNKIIKNLLAGNTFITIQASGGTPLSTTSTAADITTACTPVGDTKGSDITFVM